MRIGVTDRTEKCETGASDLVGHRGTLTAQSIPGFSKVFPSKLSHIVCLAPAVHKQMLPPPVLCV